jgi:hypothetical protein
MRRWLLPCFALLALVACQQMATNNNNPPASIAQFWRPISEPNLMMPMDKAQRKLDFDLSQCHCGIYPTNMPRSEASEFQPDKQRLAETSVTVTPNDKGQCLEQPSLVVTECMRGRGWEPTNCSGRMPLPGGGSLCAAYATSP